jgi:hypothetical protein
VRDHRLLIRVLIFPDHVPAGFLRKFFFNFINRTLVSPVDPVLGRNKALLVPPTIQYPSLMENEISHTFEERCLPGSTFPLKNDYIAW